ncbi:MAG: substrate-binding domain-containing protein [Planctomycetota bacterium]|nr:substrate-binding domain-containing protein [Planctomycetota bacterium]MDA1213544.1 substrate-binding domain-containing protein [Planctomycetota bacterium]
MMSLASDRWNAVWKFWLCCTATVLIGCPAAEVPEVPSAASDSSTTSKGETASSDDATSTTSDTSGGRPKRIMLLTNGDSPFWDAVRAGLLDAQDELHLADAGWQAVLEVNDGTPQGQIDKLRQFASQSDIVAVGVSALDAQNVAVADELRGLQKKGVKVITVDSDVDRDTLRDARFAFIGTDNLVAGQVLGNCAKHLNADGGGYVTFVGRTGAQNAIERIGGFAEGAGENFTSLDSMADDTDRTRARDNVRNAIRNHGDQLTTLVGIWSYNAPAIVDIVKELGVRDKTTVVVFDAEPLAIEEMANGQIDAMVVQNPYQMGYQGVRLLKALVEDDKETLAEMFPNHGEPEGDIFDTGLKVVVPNADSPLKKEHVSDRSEYWLLDDFRTWLKENDLTGS